MCEDLSIQLKGMGYRVIETSAIKNRVLRMLDFLSKAWFNRKKFDLAIVELYSGLAFEWAYWLVKLLRIIDKRIILVLHGGKLWEFASNHRKRALNLLKSASACCSPSTFLKENFETLGVKIDLIPNGMDISAYPFQLRRVLRPKLMWLRAISLTYNPVMAVKVANKVSERYQNMELKMIGPDKQDGSLEKLEALIEDLELQSSITMVGRIPKKEVPGWLRKGDIFINTTNTESFGVSVMEAAACGLPIVTTDAGELKKLWVNGKDAMIVPCNDSDAMADAVGYLLEHQEFAANMSILARQKVESFDWSQVLPLWTNLIQYVYEGSEES